MENENGFEIRHYPFTSEIETLAGPEKRMINWPVVYVLHSDARSKSQLGQIYVGESLNFVGRMKQHLQTKQEYKLQHVELVLSERFHKSACLDLESKLIKLAAGDGSREVLNRNDGIVDADYYQRKEYEKSFNRIFEELRALGIFQRTIPEIVNSSLFKLSPFKSLNHDQATAVLDIMEGLEQDLQQDGQTEEQKCTISLIHGDPGTGKTIIAVYMMKLLMDIASATDDEGIDGDSIFSDFFLSGSRELFQNLRIAFVVPQQSLRKTLTAVFKRTPGLDESMLITAFQLAESPESYDVVIVDEAHRLSRLAVQGHPSQLKRFKQINETLFSGTNPEASQLEWLQQKTRHLILLYDAGQTVRPGDIASEDFNGKATREYRLHSQMRVAGGNDYINYVRKIFSPQPPQERQEFAPDYEVGIFQDPAQLIAKIKNKEKEYGLSRILAGYAWEWITKKSEFYDKFDINLVNDVRLKWNTVDKDWVNSPTSIDEAGSIHTIQGYDLNYAGVIIGQDIGYDENTDQLFIRREHYFDRKGKSNNGILKIETTDQMLLSYISNVYFVLLTRGIKGTFIHAVDPAVEKYLARYFPIVDQAS